MLYPVYLKFFVLKLQFEAIFLNFIRFNYTVPQSS